MLGFPPMFGKVLASLKLGTGIWPSWKYLIFKYVIFKL